MRECIPNSKAKNHEIFCFSGMMVLEWREREYEDVDREVQGGMVSKQESRECILYKFWSLGSLRDQPRILQMFVDYWDPDTKAFQIDGMSLRLEVEDMYFITR